MTPEELALLRLKYPPAPVAEAEQAQAAGACDGSDDPWKRCGHHHDTGLDNGAGGYQCCCGDNWFGTPNRCSTGAQEGDPVSLRLKMHAHLRCWMAEDVREIEEYHEAAIRVAEAAISDRDAIIVALIDQIVKMQSNQETPNAR